MYDRYLACTYSQYIDPLSIGFFFFSIDHRVRFAFRGNIPRAQLIHKMAPRRNTDPTSQAWFHSRLSLTNPALSEVAQRPDRIVGFDGKFVFEV